MDNNFNLTKEQKKELTKIVLARIQVMPDDLNISVGSKGIDKIELTKLIKEGNEVGEEMLLTEVEFLRDLASGAVYANE